LKGIISKQRSEHYENQAEIKNKRRLRSKISVLVALLEIFFFASNNFWPYQQVKIGSSFYPARLEVMCGLLCTLLAIYWYYALAKVDIIELSMTILNILC
jgi:hypothetical protein